MKKLLVPTLLPAKIIAILSCSLAFSGCVKFEINPGDVVADTVDAGKDLYHTIKRKRSGEEERVYTHFVASKNQSEDTENNLECKKQIEENIQASSAKLSKVLSESSEVINIEGERKIKCVMTTLVRPAMP